MLVFGAASAASEPVYTCEPALPTYCQNIHLGCAGRTNRPTSDFQIADGGIAFSDGARWRVSTNRSHSGVVFRRRETNDWIRIDNDLRFSQRLYAPRGPLMAFGTCEKKSGS